jgi:PAS domain S-box-containing protein
MHSSVCPDFQALFESAPGLYLILSPALEIVAASDAYLDATMTKREEIIGRNLFEVFPDNEEDSTATGASNLHISLTHVIKSRTAHSMPIQKYDIRRPDGSFEERYWNPLNKPVLKNNELLYIIHSVEDVTEFMSLRKEEKDREKRNEELQEQVKKMKIETYKRAQETELVNQTLLKEINEKKKLQEKLQLFNRDLEDQVKNKTVELDAIVNQLKESEEKYKTIFYKAPLPMWIYDCETYYFIEANEAAVRHYGYDAQEFQAMTIMQIRPQEDLELLSKDLELIRTNQSSRQGQWRHLKKNGEIIIVETTAHSFDYRNRKARLVVINDITARLRAEEELKRKSQEIIGIFERITDGFIALDKNYCYTYLNKRIGQMLDLDPESLIGKCVWEIFPKVVDSPTYKAFHKAMAEQRYVSNVDYYEPLDLWQENHIYPSPEGLSIFIRDITEKKRIEKRLNDERKLLRSLIDNLPVYIYVKDIESRYLISNKALVDLVGARSEQETVGKTVLELFGPEIAEVNFEEDRKVVQQGISLLNREESILTRTGERRWLLTSKVPLKENDKVTGIIGISRDITERKHSELQLQHLNESLRKRASELLASNTELERFAYVASHDLQEPLRMVSSFLQLLEKKLGENLDETGRQYMNFAVDGAERMKKLIQDLLEYSRVGTSKESITEVDCNEVLENVQKVFALSIGEKKAFVTVKPLPVIQGVKSQVHQLFQNLIGNSIKYAGNKRPVIEVGCNLNNNTWQFYVKDNGIGIDPRFYEKIFIIFQRLHNRQQYAGTGIGLAICKKIVDRHNGKIWVESEPENGTTFFIEWPK